MIPLLERVAGRFAAQVATYAAGDLLVRAGSFVLLPIFTRTLSLAAFGAYGLVQLVESVMIVVLNLGMSTAVLRRRARRDAELPGDMCTAFLVTGIGGALLVALLATLATPISRVVFSGALDPGSVVIVLVGIYFATLKLFIVSILRADGRANLYAAANLAHFLLLVGTSAVLVVALDMGLRGAVLGQAASAAVVTLGLLPVALREMRPAFRVAVARALLAYGAPLMPGTLAISVITMSNRLFLEHHGGGDADALGEVAVYTLAFKIASLLHIALVTPFRTAWLPALFRLDAAGLSRVPRVVLSSFAALAGGVALWIALAGPELVRLAGTSAYARAADVVPLLLLGHVLYGIYFNVDNGVVLGRRTSVYPLVTGTAAAANLALNAWLVPRFGLLGAAWATLASYPILVAMMLAASRRSRRIPYDPWRTVFPLLLAATLYGVARLLGPDSVPLRGAVALLYPVALAAAGFLRSGDRERLREAFHPG